MKKKIFVGNLAWGAKEENLRPLFEAFGKVVTVKIITDQYTGRSKGFGFVEMENAEDAERAIQELNEKPVLDRNIRVSLAQERQDRPERSERRDYNSAGGGYGQKSFRSRDNTGNRNYR